jgi:DNA-binding MarR family transcriptional regulator
MKATDIRHRLRELLQRKTVASERHRHAMALTLGLSDTEAVALAYLARNGSLTPSELGHALSMTSGGVTALTERLVRNGHITKEYHPTDRRRRVLSPTPETIRAAERCYQPLVSDLDRVAAGLSRRDLEVVGRFLEEIVALSERHAEELVTARQESDEPRFVRPPAPGLWA